MYQYLSSVHNNNNNNDDDEKEVLSADCLVVYIRDIDCYHNALGY